MHFRRLLDMCVPKDVITISLTSVRHLYCLGGFIYDKKNDDVTIVTVIN